MCPLCNCARVHPLTPIPLCLCPTRVTSHILCTAMLICMLRRMWSSGRMHACMHVCSWHTTKAIRIPRDPDTAAVTEREPTAQRELILLKVHPAKSECSSTRLAAAAAGVTTDQLLVPPPACAHVMHGLDSSLPRQGSNRPPPRLREVAARTRGVRRRVCIETIPDWSPAEPGLGEVDAADRVPACRHGRDGSKGAAGQMCENGASGSRAAPRPRALDIHIEVLIDE